MGRSPHSRIAQEWTKLWTRGRASPRNHGPVRLFAQDAEWPPFHHGIGSSTEMLGGVPDAPPRRENGLATDAPLHSLGGLSMFNSATHGSTLGICLPPFERKRTSV